MVCIIIIIIMFILIKMKFLGGGEASPPLDENLDIISAPNQSDLFGHFTSVPLFWMHVQNWSLAPHKMAGPIACLNTQLPLNCIHLPHEEFCKLKICS